MTREEAIAALNGHAVLSEAAARTVCATLGVPMPAEEDLFSWTSQRDAWLRYGFVTTQDAGGTGIDGLALSYHVCRGLGIAAPGSAYTGKEYQARANREAITAYFKTQAERSDVRSDTHRHPDY